MSDASGGLLHTEGWSRTPGSTLWGDLLERYYYGEDRAKTESTKTLQGPDPRAVA